MCNSLCWIKFAIQIAKQAKNGSTLIKATFEIKAKKLFTNQLPRDKCYIV